MPTTPDSVIIVDGAQIDPAFVIFHKVYVQWWTEGKHPHTPRLADIEARVKEMNVEEKRIFLAGARLVGAHGQAMVAYAEAAEKFAAGRV